MKLYEEEAVALAVDASLRSLGVLVLIAEATIPPTWKSAKDYVKRQRQWLDGVQDIMEVAEEVDG